MSYVLAILALGVLIIVHEGGHYFVARWSKMRVERFSLGFGPAIIKWRNKETQFQIAPILFGGFVQITGMNPHDEFDEKDPNVYPNRPTILRFLTIFAGPFTNLAFASVLVFFVFTFAGAEVATGLTRVEYIDREAPAEGLILPGDVILKVNGDPVPFAGNAFRERVQKSEGKPILVTVRRKGTEETVTVVPKKVDDGYLIGVHMSAEVTRQEIGVLTAGWHALRYPVVKSEQILGGLWDVITRKVPAEAVGAVGMVSMISEQVRSGWISTFEFLAMLNVYLGLFNLLPLPALDGGRLVFLTYELATRRRPNPKVEAAVHMAGFAVLFILMILVMFKDIKNAIF